MLIICVACSAKPRSVSILFAARLEVTDSPTGCQQAMPTGFIFSVLLLFIYYTCEGIQQHKPYGYTPDFLSACKSYKIISKSINKSLIVLT